MYWGFGYVLKGVCCTGGVSGCFLVSFLLMATNDIIWSKEFSLDIFFSTVGTTPTLVFWHLVFPGGLPSKHKARPALLSLQELTGSMWYGHCYDYVCNGRDGISVRYVLG